MSDLVCATCGKEWLLSHVFYTYVEIVPEPAFSVEHGGEDLPYHQLLMAWEDDGHKEHRSYLPEPEDWMTVQYDGV